MASPEEILASGFAPLYAGIQNAIAQRQAAEAMAARFQQAQQLQAMDLQMRAELEDKRMKAMDKRREQTAKAIAQQITTNEQTMTQLQGELNKVASVVDRQLQQAALNYAANLVKDKKDAKLLRDGDPKMLAQYATELEEAKAHVLSNKDQYINMELAVRLSGINDQIGQLQRRHAMLMANPDAAAAFQYLKPPEAKAKAFETPDDFFKSLAPQGAGQEPKADGDKPAAAAPEKKGAGMPGTVSFWDIVDPITSRISGLFNDVSASSPRSSTPGLPISAQNIFSIPVSPPGLNTQLRTPSILTEPLNIPGMPAGQPSPGAIQNMFAPVPAQSPGMGVPLRPEGPFIIPVAK